MNGLVKETLKKQLELLSKRSEECLDETLSEITDAMLHVCKMLEQED